jgi:16S rRNA (cytosine967-C5)-methyltransferase
MSPSSLAGHVVELLDNIVRTDAPADRIISDFYKQRRYLGSHDRQWITNKIYGIIRNFILLREIGKKCVSDPKSLNIFLLHELLIAKLEAGEIQNIYSQLLELYKLTGTEINLEGLSDCSTRKFSELENSNNDLILNSFPDFFCEFLPSKVRDECPLIMEALNQEAQVCIRVDTARISREEVVVAFWKDSMEVPKSKFSPLGIYLPKRINLNNVELYKNGMIEIQEEASQLVGLIVDPRKGEVIVDACAGGGGKSLELASLSFGFSKIYALDIDKERLENLGARAARNDYTNIISRVIEGGNLAGIEDLVGAADKVVVDAPCTGSGTIRRNPDKKFRLTKSYVETKSAYQRQLLNHYSKLVRVGGSLFYATCSIFEQENQAVVMSFVESNPNFQFVDVSKILIEPKFSDLIEDGFLTIYPHRTEMDGFFVAVMKRLS